MVKPHAYHIKVIGNTQNSIRALFSKITLNVDQKEDNVGFSVTWTTLKDKIIFE